MRRHRRHDEDVRLEMTPLIDVVFLLLTFFIFSLVVMVRANLLPVELVGIGSGEAATGGDEIQAVTLSRDGQYYFNRELIDEKELTTALRKLAEQPDPPRVYVGVEEQGNVDRAPALIRLVELMRQAGVSFTLVGPPPGS